MPIEKQYITHFSKFGLIAQQVVEGFLTGLHKSPFHGFSVEFAEHKMYNTGDSTKNIDWKLYARTEKLFLKEFEEETNVRSSVVIDVSGSMCFPEASNSSIGDLNKLGFSLYATAALLLLLNRQRDACGIVLFDEKIRFASEIKGSKTHLAFLIKQLEEVLDGNIKGEGISTLSTSLHNIAEQSPKRGLLFCLLISPFIQIRKVWILFYKVCNILSTIKMKLLCLMSSIRSWKKSLISVIVHIDLLIWKQEMRLR